MHSAELCTSQPAYGMPESSSSPCTAPSSPNLPCSTGTTTSRPIVSYFPSSRTSSPWTSRSGDSTAVRPSCQPASGPSQSFHVPCSVIPIQNGSYFPVSRCPATSRADLTETGCSSPAPPKRIPTFTLSMLHPTFEAQAVDEAVFHGVAQCVVRVVRGVRADEHVRHPLQPRQGVAFAELVPAVGVENPFLS